MENYKLSGVDVDAGYQAIDLIKTHVKSTVRQGVFSSIGGFAGLFSLGAFKHMEEPVLASGTDGVGTKLKIAFVMDKHDTVGIDCVAYSVNDIICTGAEPLYFLDYIATDKVYPEKIGQIVSGVAEGCRQAGCALIGGETAELPGLYNENEYDLAGMAVGIIDKKDIIDGSKISGGDVLIGIASSGLHSNGYSLVRKIIQPNMENVSRYIAEFGKTMGEELLMPTKIYVNTIKGLISAVPVKGISNITGGGFLENVPRMLSDNLQARVKIGSWDVHPIFSYLEREGRIEREEMHNIFNMGIGLAICVAEEHVDATMAKLSEMGDAAFVIGDVQKSEAGGLVYV
ncbi:MAG: phosphoribosylformylglycinamidine cyclo-ligase [Defluviitaleaceae bacterium]|nr:phosphoribosylformylglycinamidine cyclo-ligase [Defluviitaleaceae bacterium]